jgi:predicted DCC family thiol-disulfide oxidoreductase YuxK
LIVAPVVIYDGQCKFCVAQAGKLAGGKDTITLRSFHDEGVLDDYPDLTFQSCMMEIKLIVDGRTYGGADAVVRAFAIRHPTIGRLLPVYYIPGIRPVAGAIYRWIARNRHQMPGKAT